MPVIFQGFDGRARVEVDCYSQLNLLAHAQLDELAIGSRCGGHGHCGGDRVRVTASDGALSKVTDAEREHLTAAELANGWRLACQCFPERDGQRVELAGR
jgi:ferredoxin